MIFPRKSQAVVIGEKKITIVQGSGATVVVGGKTNRENTDGRLPTITFGSEQDALSSLFREENGKWSALIDASKLPLGIHPIYLSAQETDTDWAIRKTQVGEITVVDMPKYLRGDLRAMLGEKWQYARIRDDMWLGVQSECAVIDGAGQVVMVNNWKDLGLGVSIDNSGRRSITSTITRANEGFVFRDYLSKALQSVPGKAKLSATATVKNNVATFDFPAQEMSRLEPGYYNFNITIEPKGSDKGVRDLTLATIEVLWDGKVDPSDWTMPKTLRASVGQQYRLVTPIAKDGKLPALSVSSNSKKVAGISADGILTAKKAGTATITVSDTAGAKLKCKVTVGGNSFSRGKPLKRDAKGLYTSTKKLYYQKGALVAEVFVYNRTGATIQGADGFVFELWDGDELVFARALKAMTFKSALKDKYYRTLKIVLKDELMPGASAKAYDLGIKRYNAVIRGADRNGNRALPLASWTKGVTQPKAQNARSAGMEEPTLMPAAN